MMEQINKLEIVFSGRSLEDQLNALETSLLRGGTSDPSTGCISGTSINGCKNGYGGCKSGTGGCVEGTGGCVDGGTKSACQTGTTMV
jgi:hypothetical protein